MAEGRNLRLPYRWSSGVNPHATQARTFGGDHLHQVPVPDSELAGYAQRGTGTRDHPILVPSHPLLEEVLEQKECSRDHQEKDCGQYLH